MKNSNKRHRIGLVKAIDAENKTITAHVSTFGWDRMNERFEKGSWDLGNYQNNPVVLWSHDPSQPPIGKSIEMSEDTDGLLATAQFDDQSEFAMQIFSLYQRGYLNAFSVGFIPKQFVYEPMNNDGQRGLVFLQAELLEFSAVSIPANPGAVVSRELAELAIKSLGAGAVETVEENGVKVFKPKPFAFKDGERGPEQGDELPLTREGEVAPNPDGDPNEADPIQRPDAGAPAPAAPNPDGEPAAPEPDVQPAGAPTPPDTEKSLQRLLELVKMAKGKKLDKTTVEMCGTAVSLFQEIISENSESVSRADFDSLKGAVEQLGFVVKNLHPDASETVRKIMFQVEKAIKAKAA